VHRYFWPGEIFNSRGSINQRGEGPTTKSKRQWGHLRYLGGTASGIRSGEAFDDAAHERTDKVGASFEQKETHGRGRKTIKRRSIKIPGEREEGTIGA